MGNTVWEKLNKTELKKLHAFNEDYRVFLSNSKTERTFVTNSVAFAEAHGFKPVETAKKLKAGDRYYAVNKGKNVILFVMGKKAINRRYEYLRCTYRFTSYGPQAKATL